MRSGLFFLLLFNLSTAYAQVQSDSIFVAKGFLGYKFYYQDSRVNINTLPFLMESNREAFVLATKAKKNNLISTIISGTGGFLIGWQLGVAIVGGEPNWTTAAIGGGLIVISIPIISKANRQSFLAVDNYNAGLSESSHRIHLGIGLCQNGVGVTMHF